VSAHERAAEFHDQAAVNHEGAAAFFDEHDRPEKAAHERDLAKGEAAKAEDSRAAAQTDAED
jgi:hypothetical protein